MTLYLEPLLRAEYARYIYHQPVSGSSDTSFEWLIKPETVICERPVIARQTIPQEFYTLTVNVRRIIDLVIPF